MIIDKYRRERIARFWKQYKRSKKGIIGLIILLTFILMAIFAPLLTPYDPIRDRELAEWLAYPEWVGLINREMADLPSNIKISILERSLKGEGKITLSNSSAILAKVENNFLIVKSVGSAFNAEKLELELATMFEYAFNPPKSFGIILLGKLVDSSDNFAIKASFEVVRPDGEIVWVWDSGFTHGFTRRLMVGERIYIKSSQPDLLVYLGLPIYRDTLAKKVFVSRGQYQLRAIYEFINLEPGKNVNFTLAIYEIQFIVFGLRFGLLGTDDMGRDIFTQIVYGSRVSLLIGISASVISVSLSVLIGIIAGYVGGKTDELLTRISDLIMVLPALPLMIVIAAMIGGGLLQIVILLSLLGWAPGARNIRAFVLSIKNKPYIEACKVRGAGTWRIIFKHIMPSVLPIAYAAVALSAPIAIVTEAELAYLGVGGDPYMISWGRMLQYAQKGGAFQYGAWWWIIPPGLCIALLSLSFVLIGHSLDEIFNPRLRR
ncbi:MAG: ABC transporter permease [Candidatus Bathyarchaeia archaeon]